MSRRVVDPFDRRSMLLSIIAHFMLFALGWASTTYDPPQMEFITYEIELVSPPPARQAEVPVRATERLVVERPEPEPTPPEPEVEEIIPVQAPDPVPDPPPVERDKPTEEQPPEVAEEVMVAAAPDPPREEPEATGEGLNIRIKGLRRDYPEYYNNIIRQIQRCFRWQGGGGWETTVRFSISRSGNAEGIEFERRSGNTAFDFEAMGAVDCAGQGRFGELPENLPYDLFPVRFSFRPVGDPVEQPTTGDPSEVSSKR
ncbi:MAG: TonB C-terminal domain-containing protein [Gemmatimonadetes bacterium]|nr:TonB C-terminal domain-containing protein [Gemmatimonadota bacterium]MDA1104606.1 TonB C-terminal domain-containing protein [Gemmatimonadota bacterium]